MQKLLALVKKFEAIQIVRLQITPKKIQKQSSDSTRTKRNVWFSTSDVTSQPPVTIEYVPAAGARLSTASSVFEHDERGDVNRHGDVDEARAYAPVKRRSVHEGWKSDSKDARQLFRQSAIELGTLHVLNDEARALTPHVTSRDKRLCSSDSKTQPIITEAEKRQNVLDLLEDAFPNVLSIDDVARLIFSRYV